MPLFLGASEAELIRHLNEHQVRYMVVGGHAVSFHANPRPMKDLDIWIEPTSDNAARVAQAVARINYHLSANQIEALTRPNVQFPLGRWYTEILTSCGALQFDAAISRAVPTFESGVQCHVIGRSDLIDAKRALGREQDLEDIANLEGTA